MVAPLHRSRTVGDLLLDRLHHGERARIVLEGRSDPEVRPLPPHIGQHRARALTKTLVKSGSEAALLIRTPRPWVLTHVLSGGR